MKKLLLSLLTLLAFAGVASANTATLVAKDLGLENSASLDGQTIKLNDDISIILSKGDGKTAPAYYNNGTNLRVYASNTLTVKGAEGVTLTEAKFTCSSGYGMKAGFTANDGALDFDNQTWTGSANEFVITNGTTGQFRIVSIEFTYTGNGSTVTPDPVTPTNEVADIAAFIAGTKGETYTIKSDAVAVRQLNSNLWIKDNSGWVMIYGNLGQTFENGDVIKGGYEGELDIYSGLPEMKNAKNIVKGDKVAAVEPTLVNTGDADGEPLNSYIKMTGCTINGSGRNYTCDDGSGEIALYTNSASFSVPTGTGFTVYAFVSVYNSKKQFTPVEIVSGSGREIVKTPYFTPAAGSVNAGDKVAIKCATEGATIYYTLDGSNPTAESNVYAEEIVINEDVTIKALAVKEGMDDSDIAEAAYTVFIPSANDVTFNFTDHSSLTPKYSESDYEDDGTTGNWKIDVQDVAFTEKGVSVKAVYTDPEATGTAARLYKQSTGKCQWRVYNKSSIVVTAPEGNAISKVTFEFNNGTTSSKQITAPETGTWTAPVWEAPEAGATEVSFALKGTVQINVITVTLKGKLDGVDNVAVDNENAPVEYFNLQGVRVANPENGLFIRRQGNNVSKVIIR